MMKSRKEELAGRGLVEDGAESACTGLSVEEKIELLQSKIPGERTLGARLLSDNNTQQHLIEVLTRALKAEKKLYAKIEITKTLLSFGLPAVKPLAELLGKIGSNQHTAVPQKKFNKKSYPLPRDIAARTLAHMGTTALPDLIGLLHVNDDALQLSEAIDAIGYICFYSRAENVFDELAACFNRNKQNGLIRWKIVRAMSGLPESRSFLCRQAADEQVEGIKLEIERSLSLLERAKI